MARVAVLTAGSHGTEPGQAMAGLAARLGEAGHTMLGLLTAAKYQAAQLEVDADAAARLSGALAAVAFDAGDDLVYLAGDVRLVMLLVQQALTDYGAVRFLPADRLAGQDIAVVAPT